ncbi:DNA-binding protein [Xanthomonas campestris pv. phormiicola]|nr:DNA-binding protein [Xanthomonas campestris pv. phormiicola]UYC16895.1 DNA-binding protein [Xanthomonas campestris pv. phormiicola]
MGLGKERGSSRINRYEHQVTAVGFDSLSTLAKVLEVPPAYLLADSAEMADAILALAQIDRTHQVEVTELLQLLGTQPDLVEKLLKLIQSEESRKAEPARQPASNTGRKPPR